MIITNSSYAIATKHILIFYLIFCYLDVFAQKKESINNLCSEIDNLFEVYNSLSPIGEIYYSKSLLNINPLEFSHYENNSTTEKLISGDSIKNIIAIEIYQRKIKEKLFQLCLYNEFCNPIIQDLFSRNNIFLYSSEDRKFHNLSFNSKFGYANDNLTSISFFTDFDNTKIAENYLEIETLYNEVKDIYQFNYTIKNHSEILYLLIGSSKTGVLSYNYYAKLVSFKNNKIESKFNLYFNLIDSEAQMNFDKISKKIYWQYFTDNNQTLCDCLNTEELNNTAHNIVSNIEVFNQNRLCNCEYSFDGSTFIKTSK